VILVAIEACRSHPVLPGKIDRIADPHPSLLRRIHEEQSTERPECLSSESLFRLLLENDYVAVVRRELGRGDETREARANYNCVCFTGANAASGDFSLPGVRSSLSPGRAFRPPE
jgi:hypothetical protein